MPMQSITSTYVFGAAETMARLKDLGIKVPAALMRRGLYAGAVVIRDEARRNVRKRTGSLKKALVAQTDRVAGPGGKEYRAYVAVAPKAFTRGKGGRVKLSKKKKGERRYEKGEIYPRNYAHLVEFGTRAHQAGARHHPGSPPRPFLRPAVDTKHKEAFDAIGRKLKTEVDVLVAKRAAKRVKS